VTPYTLEDARDLVREALERSEPRHKRWRALEVIYRTGSVGAAVAAAGKGAGYLETLLPGVDEDVVNMVLPHINVMIASVVSRDPKLLAEPYAGGELAETGAKAAEAVMAYYWQRTNATEALRDATRDMVILGSGLLKVNWNHVERDPTDDELDDMVAHALEMDRLDAQLADRAMHGEEQVASMVIDSTAVVEVDEPFVEWVSPYDVFVPSNARRMEDARWVAQRVTLPLDELEGNEEFNQDVELVPDGLLSARGDKTVAEWRRQAEEESSLPGARSAALDTATVWEFYDMRSRRLLVFQLDGDGALYDGDLPYSHRYSPYVHLRNYNGTGTEFWPFGDVENVASLQLSLNDLLTAQLESARRAGQKYLVAEEAMTPELRTALESDQAEVVATVNTGGMPLEQVIQSVFRPGLSDEVFAAKDNLDVYIQQVLGINDFQRGGMGADRMSATAAAVADGIATLRAQDKIASVEAGGAHVGRLMLLLCQEFLDVPTVIRVAGQAGAAWPEVDRNMLRGEFFVSVEGGSTKAVNPASREQRGMRTLTEVAPMLMELGFDPVPAVRQGLRDLGYDPDLLMQPLPEQPQPDQPEQPGLPAPAGAPMPEDPMLGPGLEAQYGGGIAL
jgi:hypothetical protein